MPRLFLKNLPRYECLVEASGQFPDLDPSATQAYLYLMRAGDEAAELVHDNLASFNLSSGRFTVLMLLMKRCTLASEKGIVTPAELADMAGCTRATMTGLVDTLERDGLVKREPDSRDRRMLTVNLT